MKALFICVAFAAVQLALPQASAQEVKVISDKAVGGFVNPESAAYDPKSKALYVGNFGSPKLDPALKDGMGYISKVGLDGKILEERYLPVAGSEPLNKPKGIWIEGGRLWVTDIDAVWIFNIKSKKGRKLALPGVGFANDPAVVKKTLYISDNRNDVLIKVEPADFLNPKREPRITEVFSKADVNPNGIYPAKDGRLLIGGFLSADKPRGLYALVELGRVQPISDPIGRIDGLYEMKDGSILATDWNTGSLFHWTAKTGKKDLATGFKGPADFFVVPNAD